MVARVQNNGLANITAALLAYASLPKFLQWGTGSGAAASANVVTTTTTTEARTNGSASQQMAALFQDATANALVASHVDPVGAGQPLFLTLYYAMLAGTSSSTTFRVRAGGTMGVWLVL